MNRHVIIPSILTEIFPSYFDYLRMNINKFNIYIGSGDYKSVMNLAHDIAGTAQSYGLREIGVISKKIETAVYENNFIEAQNLIAQYSQEVANTTYSFSSDTDMTL